MDFLNKHPMNIENQDEQNILNQSDVNVDESTDTVETSDDNQEEDVEAIKAKLQKLESDYHNQKIRAEKAEAKLKSGNSTERGGTSKMDGMSPMDLIAITKANLDEEAIREAMDYAKFKKISIAEAIKSPAVKATIQLIEENKRVAEASNTGSARRGTSKISDEVLIENARKGILPDSDADMRRLVSIRKNFN